MGQILTIVQLRQRWLELGYTHVQTLAGPTPINDWLQLHGNHGPSLETCWRFELRDDHTAIDGAVDQEAQISLSDVANA